MISAQLESKISEYMKEMALFRTFSELDLTSIETQLKKMFHDEGFVDVMVDSPKLITAEGTIWTVYTNNPAEADGQSYCTYDIIISHGNTKITNSDA